MEGKVYILSYVRMNLFSCNKMLVKINSISFEKLNLNFKLVCNLRFIKYDIWKYPQE